MIIINTTFCIHSAIATEVLDWIRNSYIPSAKKCGATSEMLTRVLGTDDPTYALHINFPSMTEAEKWNDGVAASLRAILNKRYGEKALAFHTYLEVMNNE